MSSESKQQEDGTSTASIMSRRLNDVTEAGYEAETETDKQQEEEVEVVVEEGMTSSSSSSVLHESDNENGSNIKRSGGGDGIGSDTNGVKNSKDDEIDDLETGIRNGGGVASVEESSSSTSSAAVAAAAAADEIDADNKEQTNKNCNRDHDDISDNKKPSARTDNNTDSNKKINSEDNNDIEAGNNMLIASGQKTKMGGSTSSSIDDHPTPEDDNFPSSSLPPSSLISSTSGINSINQTRSAATSSKIIRRSQSEVGAFAIDSPFSSSCNNINNNHDQDTTTITSAMMTDGVYNASVSLVGSSTTIPTNTDTNLNSQLSSGGGSYGSSHFLVEAVRVDDDCVVVASIIENNNNNNNNNTSSNNSINSNENDEGKSATKVAAAAIAVKKKHRYVIGFVAVMILIVIIIIISVFLFGNNNSNNKINTATTNNSNDKINTATTNNSNDKINTATTTITSSTKVPIPTGWDRCDYSTGSDKCDRRFEKLLEIITPFSGLDDFDLFSNEKFERNRIDAFTWLLSLDLVTTDIDLALPENELKVVQRYILALLYFSTNGQSWDEQHNFLSPNLDECDWTFVVGESDCEIDCEFHSKNGVVVKGVTCDKQGRVERLRLWWNSMSGTLPAELSYLSDGLVELNLAGGSITGAIPTSFEKLTNLELLSLNDHCLSGTIPSKLSQLPKLNILALNGNYELSGSLQEFCNGTQYKEQYIFLAANCDSDFCDTSTSLVDDMDYYEPNVECECCACCNPDTFECCSPPGDTWTSYYHGDVSSSTGIPKSFDRPCLSEKSYDWLDDECPCLEDINDDPGIFQGYCTKNCTEVGTIPSYKPQAQQ